MRAASASSGSTGTLVRSSGITSSAGALGLPSVQAGNSWTYRSPMSELGTMVARTSAGSGTLPSSLISTRTRLPSGTTLVTFPALRPSTLTLPLGYTLMADGK